MLKIEMIQRNCENIELHSELQAELNVTVQD